MVSPKFLLRQHDNGNLIVATMKNPDKIKQNGDIQGFPSSVSGSCSKSCSTDIKMTFKIGRSHFYELLTKQFINH